MFIVTEYAALTERIGKVGKALDWGSKGCCFEAHWCHCDVSLSMTLYLLLSTCTDSTQKDRKSGKKLHLHKQTNLLSGKHYNS